MAINAALREQIRQLARWACEYCGVTEIACGGQLTIDHYRPKSKGGSEDLDNLLYCCARCNEYKGDYWPEDSTQPKLWQSRREPFKQHFLALENGKLQALTETGAFTIELLRLNRPELIAHRWQRQKNQIKQRKLHQYQEIIETTRQIIKEQIELTAMQDELLSEQWELFERWKEQVEEE